MGKKLIIKGADFSANGMRTGNVVILKLASGGTNPYHLYFLPTELTTAGGTNTLPVVPSDAVLNTVTEDGEILINSNNYKSFIFGMNTTDSNDISVKELSCSYDESINDIRSAFIGVNADVVDLRGMNFGTDCDCRLMFRTASIKTLLMPDLYLGDKTSNMFYNFNSDNVQGTLDLSFIKKINSINTTFTFLKGSSVNFGSPDTSELIDSASAFSRCALQVIDLSGWDFSHITSCYRMFENCSNLKNLHLDNWKNDSATYYNNMFDGTTNLTTVFVTNCNSSQKTWLLARLNGSTAGGSSNWVEGTVSGKAALVKGS